ncbi:MAG: radical SAM protein [Firmicutes bacterium]|nr:radical SAM protein [Bacillota bacterium]
MEDSIKYCGICPRGCRVDRGSGAAGVCGGGSLPRVSRYGLHHGEEPCLSGTRGSGTVFFSGCSLRCVFCQNHHISQQVSGREYQTHELADIFLELQSSGAHNLNLVTATHFAPSVIEALTIARQVGFRLPVVYNSSGYESLETLRSLSGQVDVYLPDLKYYYPESSLRYSSASDYFEHAAKAVLEMYRQVGPLSVDKSGIAVRGLIIRHLLLPGHLEESKRIIDWIADNLYPGVWVSLMSQYTPVHLARKYPEINRTVTLDEYEQLLDHFLERGWDTAFIQEHSSASRRYIPTF